MLSDNKLFKPVHIERVALSNDNKTRGKLISLFNFQKVLANILETSGNEFLDVTSAKLYLLTKIKEILPVIVSNDKEKFIDDVNGFVKLWLSSKQVVSRFSFDSDCSIKTDCSSIWLPELHNLNIANPVLLKTKWKSSWKCYQNRFDVVEIENEFFVEIPFILKFEPKNKKKSNAKKNIKEKNDLFGEGMRFDAFLKALKKHQVEIDKIARSYRKQNFSALNGREISGGLPGLGKKK